MLRHWLPESVFCLSTALKKKPMYRAAHAPRANMPGYVRSSFQNGFQSVTCLPPQDNIRQPTHKTWSLMPAFFLSWLGFFFNAPDFPTIKEERHSFLERQEAGMERETQRKRNQRQRQRDKERHRAQTYGERIRRGPLSFRCLFIPLTHGAPTTFKGSFAHAVWRDQH